MRATKTKFFAVKKLMIKQKKSTQRASFIYADRITTVNMHKSLELHSKMQKETLGFAIKCHNIVTITN